MKNRLHSLDTSVIRTCRKIEVPLLRFALFLVYAWFGLLKVWDLSPATPLVLELLDRTMPFMSPDAFLIGFGFFEVVLGILFLFPRFTRMAFFLLTIHLVTTMLPLIILPHMVWTRLFVPTLEGQYIIKNILIIAIAVSLAAREKPLRVEA